MNSNEFDLVDEVAKEMFVRRVFNMREMKDFELKECALDCYRKARVFMEARQQVIDTKSESGA